MKVNNIFYSLQGEGTRVGIPSIFIRLSGCKAQHACQAKGIICDTNFVDYQEMEDEDILEKILAYPSKNIIWTGGEPLEQLTSESINFFKKKIISKA
ncbi:MAG: 4Fe-4S cluster-binding domain-containing protein [Chitinophagaceae bacterium]